MIRLTYKQNLITFINLGIKNFIRKLYFLEFTWVHYFLIKFREVINQIKVIPDMIPIFKKDFCGKSGFIEILAPTISKC